MIYVGIDPSYTKTGVVYIDTNQKTILFKAVTPPGSNDTHSQALYRARHITREILSVHPDEPKTVITEEPLITSQMSSRLGILAGVIGTHLISSTNLWQTQLYGVNPNAVSNTNRKLRGYTSAKRKQVSKDIALKYLSIFTQNGYSVIIHNDKLNKDGAMKKRVLSTDEAEALILCIIMMRHVKALPHEIEIELLKLNRGLNADITVNKIKE